MKPAMFTYSNVEKIFYPANKNAIAACAILSKMRLRKGDMLFVGQYGYNPILTNGQPIEVINIVI